MSNPKWTENKVEVNELNGEVISRKIISELEKTPNKFLGININSIELLLKIAGLITILIAIIEYLDKIEERTNEQKRQHIADSTANERYHLGIINYQKEQQRLDSELANRQLNFQKELDFKREELERNLANSFEQITLQRNEEIQRERREYYTASLTNSSIKMEVLLNKNFSSDAYLNAKEDLLFDLYPKIGNIGDPKILDKFYEFKNTLYVYELLQNLSLITDTLFNTSNEVSHKVKKDIEALKKAFIEKSIDSLQFYENNVSRISKGCGKLILKSREIENAAKSINEEYKLDFIKAAKIVKDSIYEKYQSYNSFLITFCNIIKHQYSESESFTENAFGIFTESLIEAKPIWDADTYELFYFNKLRNAVLNRLQNIKREYDNIVHEKLSFYDEGK